MSDSEVTDNENTEWAIEAQGKVLRLEDIPYEVVDRIADEAGERWSLIHAAPLYSLKAAAALYLYACQQLGVAPSDPLPLRELRAAFVLRPSSLPTVYDEGLPKEGGETSTT